MVSNLFGGSAQKSQYIVIVGCGRLGSLLAGQLSSQGHSVVVIEQYEACLSNLSSEFSGFSVVGDAAELATLRQAKVDKADCLLAVTSEDNINLMVAQIARTVFEIPTVLARVFDPDREAIYQELEIDTISPTQLSADLFLQKLGERFESQNQRSAK
ncbi:TrkA-N domain superfamily [Synechococcus sp. PCC 7335]|uniref:potassium channel family protein n=1 Tax=Synechococcus sp. (strain ATCC 29403 / PCC 7335) TaxID=91464 RepID=UPI00017ED8E7|nr:TrkA family potassium uptake protein [Synechococcus sp. PCC 7335]EDX86858.1 TrkA-N domain superfamily [Synechococcus sp. PCC 7335]